MNLAANPLLKKLILDRLKQIEWKDAFLIQDAAERNYTINRSQFSKWRNGRKGGLSDDDVWWIMERLGIKLNVNFGSPVVREGKLVYEVDKYSELDSIKRVNILFGNGKETTRK